MDIAIIATQAQIGKINAKTMPTPTATKNNPIVFLNAPVNIK